MDIFHSALGFVLRWEGGFVDDPEDHGGATNKGITQSTYDLWRHNNHLPEQSVKLITEAEVETIYRQNYWDRLAARKMEPNLYFAAFNCAVNMGVTEAKILLNQAGNSVEKFLDLQEEKYREYARFPGQGKFLQGWLNRLKDLRKTLGLK